MNRRNFLQALGMGGSVTALSACGIDNNRYYTPIEQVLPYVVRPEQATPGMPSFFATTIGSGLHAYPALALHREGRVVNVTANRMTSAAPAVTSRTLLELQRHYSPDRFKQPQFEGVDTTWDDGLKKLADAASGKSIAYLGPYRSGSFVDLVNGITGGNAVFWEPLGREAEAAASEKLFGTRALPAYDLAKAHYVLSFGAEFLGGAWGGAKTQASFAAGRNPNNGHFVARYALVSGHRGQSGANADDWHKVAPGSEVLVALAIAKLVADKSGYRGPAKKLVASGDAAKAAAAAGIDVSAIEAMAEHFGAGPAIALPGGVAGASTAAADLAAAVFLLNVVSNHHLMHSGGYRGPVHGYDAVEKLIADMKGGKIGVLFIDDLNPVHSLPTDAGFAEALAAVPMSVSLSSHPDDTTKAVKLILPASDSFEDWGDEEPWTGFGIVRQPSMTPLHDTRSAGDVLLATWRATTADAPEGNWRDYVKASLADTILGHKTEDGLEALETPANPGAAEPAELVFPVDDPAFVTWWREALTNGSFTTPEARGRKLAVTGGWSFGGAGAMAGGGEYHLVPFEHSFLGDGRFANVPWAQEAPDPLSGHVWDTWVVVSPATAEKLGVGDNDLVKLTTDKGSIDLGVEVLPIVRDDVVAVPFGNGHTAGGRYTEGIGRNVVDLLSAIKGVGGIAWQQAKVSVAKANAKANLTSVFGFGDHDPGRNWIANAPAAKVAEHGDAPADHPGHQTGIHHLPMDRRLQAKGITNFYPAPDHPTYRFGFTVDTDACTGCGACSVACYAENNLPVVGKHKVAEGREMSWIRINRYIQSEDEIHFLPLMCQQCAHAPCESVCPVLATYHTLDGLNAMIYNRCAGTRYCANACPYSLRRFNYHSYIWPEPFNLQLNPDVVTRTMGVTEKGAFGVQRIRRVKSAYKNDGGFKKTVPDEVLTQLPACADACPSQAMTFGNLVDEASKISLLRKSGRTYTPIHEINTMPAVNYLAKANFHKTNDSHGAENAAAATDNHEPASHDAGGH